MRGSIQVNIIFMALIGALAAFAGPAWTQERSSSNMEILREKIKADKKLIVAVNMGLTRAEEKSFWQIYDEYQRDLEKLNKRIGGLLRSYAKDYRNKTLTDDKAKKLLDEFLSIEQAEAKLKGSYVPKLSLVLPAKKVVRYLQIENKIRAIIRYDLAAGVPLVK
jgi:flagellar motor switch protein FliG